MERRQEAFFFENMEELGRKRNRNRGRSRDSVYKDRKMGRCLFHDLALLDASVISTMDNGFVPMSTVLAQENSHGILLDRCWSGNCFFRRKKKKGKRKKWF